MLAAGSAPAEELLRRARELGHAEKTVRRAKADLGIRAYRVGQAREQRWFWIFPEMANTHPAEIANDNADMATLTPLAISPTNREMPLLVDLPAATTQVVADERPDRGVLDVAPAAVLVPPGFIIPPGVECDGWDRKPAPLKLDRGVTVSNVEDFVKTHLEVLAAKLRGDKGWLCDQWPLDTLLADLKKAGVELRIPVGEPR